MIVLEYVVFLHVASTVTDEHVVAESPEHFPAVHVQLESDVHCDWVFEEQLSSHNINEINDIVIINVLIFIFNWNEIFYNKL